jgi:hypothetical protein
MKPGVMLVLLNLIVVTGCGVIEYGTKNLIESPLSQFGDLTEECRNSKHAEKAWKEITNSNPERIFSVHFERGFKDGFTDYLFAGGSGNPPVAPPWRYQKVAYQSPQGVEAVEDWFAGFREGTAAAQASGLREVVLVPVSPSLTVHGPVPSSTQPQTDTTTVLPMPRTSPPEEKNMPPVPPPE